MMADDLEARARHQPRRHAADVAESLDHHARRFAASMPKRLQRLQRDDHAAAPGRFRPAARPAQFHRLAGHHRRQVWRVCME